LHALWSPKGQQIMAYTPAQPTRRFGIGAVNYHTGQTVVLLRPHKRRREIAELLQALLDQHPRGTVYVAWDNANTHEDDEVEAVVRGGGRPARAAVPTHLQPVAQSNRDALAPFPPRGHAL
jgi:putative transposase